MSNEESLNFVFSEDVKLLETADLEDYCLHLLCKEGEGSFVYNDRCFLSPKKQSGSDCPSQKGQQLGLWSAVQDGDVCCQLRLSAKTFAEQ